MTEPAPAESIDDRIARLRRELADAEIDKAGTDLGDALRGFEDLQPDLWEFTDKPEPTADEIRAASGFVRDAYARFEAWLAAHRAAAAETTERRPYLALAALAVPTPAPVAFQKRPSGSGSTYRSGNGWKWRLQVNGSLKRGRTWPTREEAEAELALAVADPAFVPVKADYKRLSPTSKHHCSRCGAGDHKANRCPTPASPDESKPTGGTTPEKAESRARIDTAVVDGRAATAGPLEPSESPGLAAFVPDQGPEPEPTGAHSEAAAAPVDPIAWLLSLQEVSLEDAPTTAAVEFEEAPLAGKRRAEVEKVWCYRCRGFGHGPKDPVVHPGAVRSTHEKAEEIPDTGGVWKVPGGYRWRVGSRNGGRFPTEEEAQADLVRYARKRLGMAGDDDRAPASDGPASPADHAETSAACSTAEPPPAPPPAAPTPPTRAPVGEATATAPPEFVSRIRAKARPNETGRVLAKTFPARRLSRVEKRDAVDYPEDVVRPRTRDDCKGGQRPCPFVSCSHHLYLDVNPESGAIKLNFPHLDAWEMAETCSLDVADRGGITLEEVGAILNLTRERIRQVEVRGLDKLRAALPEAAAS